MRLYVGNLPWSTDEHELRAHFESAGPVRVVKLIHDKETGKPKGFGFVDMADSDARDAIMALNGQELGGRTLKVAEANPLPPRHEDPRGSVDRPRGSRGRSW